MGERHAIDEAKAFSCRDRLFCLASRAARGGRGVLLAERAGELVAENLHLGAQGAVIIEGGSESLVEGGVAASLRNGTVARAGGSRGAEHLDLGS